LLQRTFDDRLGSPLVLQQPAADVNGSVTVHVAQEIEKKLDDALGHFRVQITCKCGAQRIAEPEALVRLCGSSATLDSAPRGFGESCRYHPRLMPELRDRSPSLRLTWR